MPEFLYQKLYNDKGHMMGVNGFGRKGWKPLQHGIKQKLFCEECEQFFGKHFEVPFKRQWIDRDALPALWPSTEEPVQVRIEYPSFKLFHLSVLFRASVSTLPTFAEVKLGLHEERIRQMLLARDPGPAWLYPIMGVALINPQANEPAHLITRPVQARFETQRCYSVSYGGVNWLIAVASHPNNQWTNAAATEAGTIPLLAMPWTELGLIRQASQRLQKLIS